MIRLNCDELYSQYMTFLKETIEKNDSKIKLVSFRVGEDPGAISYERALSKDCKGLGINLEKLIFEEGYNQEDLKNIIREKNQDHEVSGIIIFKPMIGDYNEEEIFQLIDPDKDVDGCNFINKSKVLDLSDKKNLPATASAIHLFIKSEIPDITGKNVIIVNRSHTIGIPLFFLLQKDNATVTLAHSRSKNIEDLMADKDIIVSATGRSHIFKPGKLKDSAMIIDMGISQDKDGKYTGDLDPETIARQDVSYMPSIGGIGKLTRAVILENTIANHLGDEYGK